MAMRPAARKFEREELIAYIHGVDAEGDLAHILVHKRGSQIRFSGRLGDHKVAGSKSEDLDQWVQEAEMTWGLDATIGVMRGWMSSPDNLEKMEALNIRAAAKKKELGLDAPEQAQLGLTDAA